MVLERVYKIKEHFQRKHETFLKKERETFLKKERDKIERIFIFNSLNKHNDCPTHIQTHGRAVQW